MPIRTDVYSDPDYIAALYDNPENELLLTEILSQTGMGAAINQNASATGGDSVVEIVDVFEPGPLTSKTNPLDLFE